MEGSIQDISQKDNEKRANLIITGVDGGEGDRWVRKGLNSEGMS